MSLGRHVPEWAELAYELDRLARASIACNAVVTDAWQCVWCRAQPLDGEALELVAGLTRAALATSARPLARGGRVDATGEHAGHGFYARSFAGVYLLLLWWDDPRLATTPLLGRALPRIEALTVKLPPPSGPSATSGAAAKQRA